MTVRQVRFRASLRRTRRHTVGRGGGGAIDGARRVRLWDRDERRSRRRISGSPVPPSKSYEPGGLGLPGRRPPSLHPSLRKRTLLPDYDKVLWTPERRVDPSVSGGTNGALTYLLGPLSLYLQRGDAVEGASCRTVDSGPTRDLQTPGTQLGSVLGLPVRTDRVHTKLEKISPNVYVSG